MTRFKRSSLGRHNQGKSSSTPVTSDLSTCDWCAGTFSRIMINDVHCSTKGTAGNDRSARSGSNVCATVQAASLAVAVVLVYCTTSTSGKECALGVRQAWVDALELGYHRVDHTSAGTEYLWRSSPAFSPACVKHVTAPAMHRTRRQSNTPSEVG